MGLNAFRHFYLILQREPQFAAEESLPILAPLAIEDGQRQALQINVLNAQSKRLAHAQPTTIHQLNNEFIAPFQLRQNGCHFVLAQHRGQASLLGSQFETQIPDFALEVFFK